MATTFFCFAAVARYCPTFCKASRTSDSSTILYLSKTARVLCPLSCMATISGTPAFRRLRTPLVIREGLGSTKRLHDRGTLRLANRLRLTLEPECLENRRPPPEKSRDGTGSIRDTQTVCGFRYWASKFTPLFHTINTMVAIFLAKVRRAISGRMPLASNAA